MTEKEIREALEAGVASVIDAHDLARLGLAIVVAPPDTRQLKLTEKGLEFLGDFLHEEKQDE